MEEEGCPPPAKQAKLSRYGFQVDGNASTASSVSQTPREDGSMLNENGAVGDAGRSTRDQETDALESPEPRSSNSSLLTDCGGSLSCSSAESSTESAHELGKSPQ